MSANVASVLAAAEALSDAERRELVDLLIAGLDDPEPVTTTLSKAWLQELARREEEERAGRNPTVSWESVQARWQARRAADG